MNSMAYSILIKLHIRCHHCHTHSPYSLYNIGGRPEGSGGGGGNLEIILVRVWEPVFWIRPQSYTWPLKKTAYSCTFCTWFHTKLTYSYTVLWINIPFHILCYMLISLQMTLVMRTPALCKCEHKGLTSVRAKTCAFCMHGCQKILAIQMPKIRKSGHSHVYFLFKKRGLSYTWQRWKGGYSAHPYYDKYRELPPPPPRPPQGCYICLNYNFQIACRSNKETINTGIHSRA